MSANAMNILERYGLAAQVRGEGVPIESFIVLLGMAGLFKIVGKLYAKWRQPAGGGNHRGQLQQVLLGALSPDTLSTGKQCMQISTHTDHAEAMFGDGTKVSAAFIVGADGIRSAVRKLLFPDCALRYSGQTCWRGVATMTLPATIGGGCRSDCGNLEGIQEVIGDTLNAFLVPRVGDPWRRHMNRILPARV